MKKLLLHITERQELIFKQLSAESGAPIAELIRRALDEHIENCVKKGSLIRFTYSTQEKSADIEMTKSVFESFYEEAKAHPEVFKITEDPK